MIFHTNISFNDKVDKLPKTYWSDSRLSWRRILLVPTLCYANEVLRYLSGESDEDLGSNGESYLAITEKKSKKQKNERVKMEERK